MKRVFYNGRKVNKYPSQPASDLRTGRVYEVIAEKQCGEQLNFILKGMPVGEGYNSEWFKVATVYVAYANEVPVVGEKLGNISRFEPDFVGTSMSMFVNDKVLQVICLGENLYEVYTKFVTYILMVKSRKN